MSNALHELTITLLKRQHEEELTKVKAERNKFMDRFMEMKADYMQLVTERDRLLRQLRLICDRVDISREELQDIFNLERNKP